MRTCINAGTRDPPTREEHMEEILTKEVLGIQHIVESSAIVSFLATWNNVDNEEEKEEAEKKIAAFFPEGITMIFIPTLEIEEELGRNMISWNRGHSMKGGKLFGSHSGVMC